MGEQLVATISNPECPCRFELNILRSRIVFALQLPASVSTSAVPFCLVKYLTNSDQSLWQSSLFPQSILQNLLNWFHINDGDDEDSILQRLDSATILPLLDHLVRSDSQIYVNGEVKKYTLSLWQSLLNPFDEELIPEYITDWFQNHTRQVFDFAYSCIKHNDIAKVNREEDILVETRIGDVISDIADLSPAICVDIMYEQVKSLFEKDCHEIENSIDTLRKVVFAFAWVSNSWQSVCDDQRIVEMLELFMKSAELSSNLDVMKAYLHALCPSISIVSRNHGFIPRILTLFQSDKMISRCDLRALSFSYLVTLITRSGEDAYYDQMFNFAKKLSDVGTADEFTHIHSLCQHIVEHYSIYQLQNVLWSISLPPLIYITSKAINKGVKETIVRKFCSLLYSVLKKQVTDFSGPCTTISSTLESVSVTQFFELLLAYAEALPDHKKDGLMYDSDDELVEDAPLYPIVLVQLLCISDQKLIQSKLKRTSDLLWDIDYQLITNLIRDHRMDIVTPGIYSPMEQMSYIMSRCLPRSTHALSVICATIDNVYWNLEEQQRSYQKRLLVSKLDMSLDSYDVDLVYFISQMYVICPESILDNLPKVCEEYMCQFNGVAPSNDRSAFCCMVFFQLLDKLPRKLVMIEELFDIDIDLDVSSDYYQQLHPIVERVRHKLGTLL